MKITKRQLKRIIKEEYKKLILENWRNLSREDLVSEIKAEYNVSFIKTTEEFGTNPGGLWMSAEDPRQVGKNDFPLFDYYSDEFDPKEKTYTMGVLKEFEKFLADRGWYAEFYDGGTVMLWEM